MTRYTDQWDEAFDLLDRRLSATQMARELGVSTPTVKRWAEYNGIILPDGRGAKKGVQDTARSEKMALMYRQGVTLEKIGQTFGVTRERARQLLKKQGITGEQGGAVKAAKSKNEAKLAQKNAKCLARYGLTYAQYRELIGTGLLKSYRNQENSAGLRGIDWSISLAQWLEVWRASGKLDQRGRGKGKYVMSRIRDTGGYEIGNVHIQLATENSREAVAKWRGKTKANRGVFRLYPGSTKPYFVKVGRTKVGFFATEEEAIAARAAYMDSNGYTLNDAGSACRKAIPA